MDAKAFIFYQPHEKTTVPVMVVIFDENGIAASGDPETYYSQLASSIVSDNQPTGKEAIQDALEGFMDSNPVGPFQYGGRLEAVDYVGKEKTRVDTIRNEFAAKAKKGRA